jgi:uncharacterized protein (DUF2132 family)
MTDFQSKDPLHGITLEKILNQLVQQYGWAELAKRIPIGCFLNEPSLKSSLKFLRRTPWARTICQANRGGRIVSGVDRYMSATHGFSTRSSTPKTRS